MPASSMSDRSTVNDGSRLDSAPRKRARAQSLRSALATGAGRVVVIASSVGMTPRLKSRAFAQMVLRLGRRRLRGVNPPVTARFDLLVAAGVSGGEADVTDRGPREAEGLGGSGAWQGVGLAGGVADKLLGQRLLAFEVGLRLHLLDQVVNLRV